MKIAEMHTLWRCFCALANSLSSVGRFDEMAGCTGDRGGSRIFRRGSGTNSNAYVAAGPQQGGAGGGIAWKLLRDWLKVVCNFI